MAIITLDHVPSTNTWAKEHADELAHGDVVLTHCQTAGRGQRGNCWEAEPGKNLTFSLMLRQTGIRPSEQFTISEAVALGVIDTLRKMLSHAVEPERITVKWPNDIYVDNLKVAGILIEHTISGSTISHTVAGIGLNVNQTRFVSDAPNPVSMAQIAHSIFPLDATLGLLTDNILSLLTRPNHMALHQKFMQSMWRNDGQQHLFRTPDNRVFSAIIKDVSPDGMLHLLQYDGTISDFAFKEVAFELS